MRKGKYTAEELVLGRHDDYREYIYNDYYDNYGYDQGHYGQDDLHIRMQKSKRKKNKDKAKHDVVGRQKMQIESLTATVQRFDDQFKSLKSKFEKTMVFKFPTDLEIVLFLKGPVNIHYNNYTSTTDISTLTSGIENSPHLGANDNNNSTNNNDDNNIDNKLILRKKQLVEKASIQLGWNSDNKEYLSQFRQLKYLNNNFKNLLTSVKNKIETVKNTLKKDETLMKKFSSAIQEKEKKLINLQKCIDGFIRNHVSFLRNQLILLDKKDDNTNNNNNNNNKGSNSKEKKVVLKRDYLVFDVGHAIKMKKITNLADDHCKKKDDSNCDWNSKLRYGLNYYPSYLDSDFGTDINIYDENEIMHYVECVMNCFLIGINENQKKEICFCKQINYCKINLLDYLFEYYNVPYVIGRVICEFGEFSNDCGVYTIKFNSKLNATHPKEFAFTSSSLVNGLSLNWVLKRFCQKSNNNVNNNNKYEMEEKTDTTSSNNMKNSSRKPSMNRNNNNEFENDNNCIAVIDAKERKTIMLAEYRDGITKRDDVYFRSHSSDIFNKTDKERFSQKQTIFTYLDKYHKFLQAKNHEMFQIEKKLLKEKEQEQEKETEKIDHDENDSDNENRAQKSEIEIQIEKEREIEFENYQFYKHLQKCLTLRVKKDKLKLHCKCSKSACY